MKYEIGKIYIYFNNNEYAIDNIFIVTEIDNELVHGKMIKKPKERFTFPNGKYYTDVELTNIIKLLYL